MHDLSSIMAQVFSEVCREDGVVSVGLATTEETGVTMSKKIPMPSNVTHVRDQHGLLRVALWSANKYDEENSITG